jgi:two-component system OmpR family sensor kinase
MSMAKPRRALHSLSRRLLLAMVALVGASLLLVDTGAVFFLHSVLWQNLELQLVNSIENDARFFLRTGGVRGAGQAGKAIAIYNAGGQRVATIGATPTTVPPLGVSQHDAALRDVVTIPGGYFLEQIGLNGVTRPVGILEEVLALVTVAAMLLAAGVAEGVARSLTGPLSALSAEAARISDTGDLETHLPQDHGVQEIRSLAESLQRMLARLSQMFGALEASEHRERALREMTLHDLRTPLATVLGTLELLASGRLGRAEAKEAAGLAQLEASRLAGRIRDLDTQEGDPLSDLGQEVRRTAHGHAVTAGAEGVLAAAPAAEVRQVLGILVDNAERHNPQGTLVELGWRRDGEMALAWVRDAGEGMTPDVAAHAFDRFYRGDRQGGLGLGLALAKVLVESRGGSVALETGPGKGTRVEVRWPAGAPPAEPA